MYESAKSFTWWHRDEIQVYIVYLIIIIFFGKSSAVEVALLSFATLALAGLWLFRWCRKGGRQVRMMRRVIELLPPQPWDRSRLVMSLLSTAIILLLFIHRLQYFLRGLRSPAITQMSFATPLDLYWLMLLGWYGLVWTSITAFLLFKWKYRAEPVEHKFFEGLVGSMYFYHGLPARSRVMTFVAGFFLGGVPTAYAVQLDPADPAGMGVAAVLIIPVASLILFGAWFASRWVGTTPSGEV